MSSIDTITVDSFPASLHPTTRQEMLDTLRREYESGLVEVTTDGHGHPSIFLPNVNLAVSPALYAVRFQLRAVVDDMLASMGGVA